MPRQQYEAMRVVVREAVAEFTIRQKSYIPLSEAEPEDMTRPKVASHGEVARGLRPSGGATSYSPRYAGPLPPPTAPGILCSSRNSNCRFNHFSTAADLPRRARGGASALDNLGTICAQLLTGAGGSPFALRFRDATRRATRPCSAHGRTSARLSDNSNIA